MVKLVIIKFCILFSLFVLFCSQSRSQAIPFTPENVGTIVSSKTGEAVGTGFVAGSKNYVITCAHVIEAPGDYFYNPVRSKPASPNTKKLIPLKLLYTLPNYDLAVLTLSENVTEKPFEWGDFRRLRPGDKVVYIGWQIGTNNLQASVAKLSAIGSVLNENAVVEFLEFEGVGKPGFSGGPVVDLDGKVVAIIREAWTKRGLKGGTGWLMNRAFSTDPLSVITKQIMVKTVK
jgi:serine protease Do